MGFHRAGWSIKRVSRIALAAALIAPAAIAAPAFAQAQTADTTQTFDIPAGDLAQALQAFTAATGGQLVYSSDIVQGLRTSGVSGSMSRTQALAQLLAGTGLTFRVSGSGAITIERLPNASGERVLSAVRVEGSQSTAGAGYRGGASRTLSPYDAQTEDTGSYTSLASTVAGKVSTPLRETPNSISVVTRERLNDQDLDDLASALDKTVGVVVAPAGGEIYIRAFAPNLQIDGTTRGWASKFFFPDLDLAVYDRVEVRKGPDGLFRGQGEPGGTINLARKRPTQEFRGVLSAEYDENASFRQEVDISVPVTDHLGIRLVGVYDDRQSFVDQVNSKRRLLYGIVQYSPSSTTQIAAGFELSDTRSLDYPGVPIRDANGTRLNLSRSTYLGVNWANSTFKNRTYFVEFEQTLGGGWSLKATWEKFRYRVPVSYNLNVGGYLESDNTGVFGSVFPSQSTSTGDNWDTYISGDTTIFGKGLQLLLGFNLSTVRSSSDSQQFIPFLDPFPIDPFDYDPASDGPLKPAEPRFDFLNRFKSKEYGAYINAKLDVIDDVKIIGGGRVTKSDNDAHFVYIPFDFEYHNINKENWRFTPYAGITWDFIPDVTAYLSYADLYESQASRRTLEGQSLPPAIGQQWEVGVKSSLLENKLNVSLALFNIHQMNRAVSDPRDPTFEAALAIGDYKSSGLEIEFSGEILEGLKSYGGYTFNKVEMLVATAPGVPFPEVGQSFNGAVPRHQALLGATYQFRSGFLQGLEIGASGKYTSKTASPGSVSGTTEFRGAYALFDLNAGYEVGKVRFSLNVRNLLDRRYFESIGDYGSRYGEPRTVTLGASVRF